MKVIVLAPAGMVFSHHRSQKVGYMTLCEDLFRDIKETAVNFCVTVDMAWYWNFQSTVADWLTAAFARTEPVGWGSLVCELFRVFLKYVVLAIMPYEATNLLFVSYVYRDMVSMFLVITCTFHLQNTAEKGAQWRIRALSFSRWTIATLSPEKRLWKAATEEHEETRVTKKAADLWLLWRSHAVPANANTERSCFSEWANCYSLFKSRKTLARDIVSTCILCCWLEYWMV